MREAPRARRARWRRDRGVPQPSGNDGVPEPARGRARPGSPTSARPIEHRADLAAGPESVPPSQAITAVADGARAAPHRASRPRASQMSTKDPACHSRSARRATAPGGSGRQPERPSVPSQKCHAAYALPAAGASAPLPSHCVHQPRMRSPNPHLAERRAVSPRGRSWPGLVGVPRRPRDDGEPGRPRQISRRTICGQEARRPAG
jgi:hypothetical protein